MVQRLPCSGRLTLQPCNTLDPPSFRDNPQLFLDNYPKNETRNIARFLSLLNYPDCPQCGVLMFQGLSALPKPSKYLPERSEGTDYRTAGMALVR